MSEFFEKVLELEQVVTVDAINGRQALSLGKQAMASMRLGVVPSFYQDAMFLRLYTYIWKETLDEVREVKSVSYPATAWQHFKQERFPKWALKRWPVKLKTKNVLLTCRLTRSYPQCDYLAERCGRGVLRFAKHISSAELFEKWGGQ